MSRRRAISPLMNSSRREFLRSVGLFGGAVLFSRAIVACGTADSRGDGETSENALVTCGSPVISNNHGHALDLPPADVAAGVEKTYSIKGASNHPHDVTITAAQFATLAAGGTVTVASTVVGGHAHQVTVTCSGASAPPPDAGSPDAAETCGATAISANHGHALQVPAEDVAAGVAKTYSIKGASNHPHDVALTASDFADLTAGKSLTVVSSVVGGHSHTVTVTCS